MRATLFSVVCATASGCVTAAPPTQPTSTDLPPEPAKSVLAKHTRPAPKKAAPKVEEPIAFDGLTNTVSNDYLNNPDRADAKYKGKRVRLKGRIDHIGQRDGALALGYCGLYDKGRIVEPTVVFVFARADEGPARDVRKGLVATVEGTCRGRTEDDIERVPGYTFYVRVEGCKLLTVESEPRK